MQRYTFFWKKQNYFQKNIDYFLTKIYILYMEEIKKKKREKNVENIKLSPLTLMRQEGLSVHIKL
jgi:hypothetical protein